MNILPKKSWHVRRKHNIERVRKDEAQALEKELELQKRSAQYETESKLMALRESASTGKIFRPAEKLDSWNGSHINFFENIEKGSKLENFVNEEKELEKKEELENWEKKVGILTYLGQSVVDAQKNTPWYLKKQDSASSKGHNLKESKEIDHIFSAATQKKLESQNNFLLNPKNEQSHSSVKGMSVQNSKLLETLSFLHKFNSVKPDLDKKVKHHKSSKKKKRASKTKSRRSSSESSASSHDSPRRKKVTNANLDKLRLERYQRENQERIRTENLLRSEGILPPVLNTNPSIANEHYYNSQFNPDIIHNMHKK